VLNPCISVTVLALNLQLFRFLDNLYLSLKDVCISDFFFHGAAAPSGPGPPHYRGFTITLRHTPHSVGLLWMSDQPVTEASN
jgi:hypothetical protein